MNRINELLKELGSKQWLLNWFYFAFFVCGIAALIFINRSLAVNTTVLYQLTEHAQSMDAKAKDLEARIAALEKAAADQAR